MASATVRLFGRKSKQRGQRRFNSGWKRVLEPGAGEVATRRFSSVCREDEGSCHTSVHIESDSFDSPTSLLDRTGLPI